MKIPLRIAVVKGKYPVGRQSPNPYLLNESFQVELVSFTLLLLGKISIYIVGISIIKLIVRKNVVLSVVVRVLDVQPTNLKPVKTNAPNRGYGYFFTTPGLLLPPTLYVPNF